MVPQSKGKDQWDWSVGWAIQAHAKPSEGSTRSTGVFRRSGLEVNPNHEAPRRRVAVGPQAHGGQLPRHRQATSKMQQWRGYTFFRIKEKDERPSSGTQKKVMKVKEKASSSSARTRTWDVGYVKGGPVERGAEAGLGQTTKSCLSHSVICVAMCSPM